MDTDLERILTLRPDLIVIHGQHDNAIRFCEQNGIASLRIAPNDVAGLYEAIVTIGGRLGCQGEAEQLVASMKSEIERIRLEAGVSVDELLDDLRKQRERYNKEKYGKQPA